MSTSYNPHCKGGHSAEKCGTESCKGKSLCGNDCRGCPDDPRLWSVLCKGGHNASTCGTELCRGKSKCVRQCQGCPDDPQSNNPHCKGGHNASTCGTESCRERSKCVRQCQGCPDDPQSNNPHCKGGHNVSTCGTESCRGRSKCVRQCQGCPDDPTLWNANCKGGHSASTCGTHACRGKSKCVRNCEGCPDNKVSAIAPRTSDDASASASVFDNRNHEKLSAGAVRETEEEAKTEAKRQAHVQEDGRGECSICLVNPTTHIFVPCGHKCICATCQIDLHAISACPICQTTHTACIRVYDT